MWAALQLKYNTFFIKIQYNNIIYELSVIQILFVRNAQASR